ncbi:MAG: DNA-directed RNA polymerase subunit P [Nanoarchaeota archaeon]
MTTYKCFKCGKQFSAKSLEKTTGFKCTNCGGKIFYKPRTAVRKIKAI